MRKSLAILVATAFFSVPVIANAEVEPLNCTSDGASFSCDVDGSTNQKSVTYSLKLSEGTRLPLGTFPMSGGAGVMIVTNDSLTFKFDEKYLEGKEVPYHYHGQIGGRSDNYNYEGPFSITIDGKTFTYNPGGYCDADCKSQKEHTTHKATWDNGDGTVGANIILGMDDVTVGRSYNMRDIPGDGLKDCTSGDLMYQTEDGGWASTGLSTSGLRIEFQAQHKAAHLFTVTCKIDGTRPYYSDTAVIDGERYTVRTSAVWASADGSATPKPTPSVTPTPTKTPVITPTPKESETSKWTPSATPSPTSSASSVTPQPSSKPSPSVSVTTTPSNTPTPVSKPSSTKSTIPPKQKHISVRPSTTSTPRGTAPVATTVKPKIHPTALPHTGDEGNDPDAWMVWTAGALLAFAVCLFFRKENH